MVLFFKYLESDLKKKKQKTKNNCIVLCIQQFEIRNRIGARNRGLIRELGLKKKTNFYLSTVKRVKGFDEE